MTPGSYCYFDGYQDNPMTQPQAFTGYLPLSKVYSYDPAPEQMAGRDRVLGVQANLWTEYIPTPEQAEYMLYPRAFALAEVAWSPQKGRDYDEFRTRALIYTERAREAGYNAFDLESEEGERPESLEPVEHLAGGCPVSHATPWPRSYPADGAAAIQCSSHFFDVGAQSFHLFVDIKLDAVKRDFLTDSFIDFFFGDLSAVCQRGT